jgi:hypothetical protein
MTYLVSILFSLASNFGFSCSCTPPDVAEAYDQADVVITAKVIKREIFQQNEDAMEADEFGYTGYLIEVIENYKGKMRKARFWILQSDMTCGASLKVGSSYLIYARTQETIKSQNSKNASELHSSYCFRTMNLDLPEVKDDLAYLENINP